MTLQTLVALMIAGVQKDAGLIANKLARRKSRQVCINALKKALKGAVTGTTCRIHDFVVDGENAQIKLAVYKGDQVVALVEFKIWMAADILELVEEGKLTKDRPPHGIYGAYKADYDKLVAAREQTWPDDNVPLTASCTLIYFLTPAAGPGAVPVYQHQVAAGLQWQANNPNRCQVDTAAKKFLGMLAAHQRGGALAKVNSTSITSELMVLQDWQVVNTQGRVTLAAVWTEILEDRCRDDDSGTR